MEIGNIAHELKLSLMLVGIKRVFDQCIQSYNDKENKRNNKQYKCNYDCTHSIIRQNAVIEHCLSLPEQYEVYVFLFRLNIILTHKMRKYHNFLQALSVSIVIRCHISVYQTACKTCHKVLDP